MNLKIDKFILVEKKGISAFLFQFKFVNLQPEKIVNNKNINHNEKRNSSRQLSSRSIQGYV